MRSLFRAIRSFLTEQKGANGVEYALLAGLIAIGFVLGSRALGISLDTFFSNTSNCVNTMNVSDCSTPFDGSGNGSGNGNGNGNGAGKGSGKGKGKG